MRPIPLILALILLAPFARADELLDQLAADAEKGKVLKEGIKLFETWFKADSEANRKGRKGLQAAKKRDDTLTDIKDWLDATERTLGVDLRKKLSTMIELIDNARVKYLTKPRGKGKLEYVKVSNAIGMERFEYTLLVPKSYDLKGRVKVPCVVSLHGRVIDPRHPAFRGGDFAERSRQVVWNHWLKTPAAENVMVIAPTGNPNGFRFNEKSHADDLQALYRTVGAALTHYRVDWNRIFIELQGEALRLACEQPFLFAGFILRDRIDDRHKPLLPEEDWFILENLNGVPLLYVADEANWDKVGKPTSEALKAAYEKAGKPANLHVIKGRRDAKKALKGDPDRIAKFLAEHRRPDRVDHFTWRFENSYMATPTPVMLTRANFLYEPSQPLSVTAGSLTYDLKRVVVEGQPQTVIDMQITEAEDLDLFLHDGMADLDQPLTVRINGKVYRDKIKVQRDWDLFWHRVLPRRFFMIPYLARLQIEFKEVARAQWEDPKAKEQEQPGGEAAGEKPGPAGGETEKPEDAGSDG